MIDKKMEQTIKGFVVVILFSTILLFAITPTKKTVAPKEKITNTTEKE